MIADDLHFSHPFLYSDLVARCNAGDLPLQQSMHQFGGATTEA